MSREPSAFSPAAVIGMIVVGVVALAAVLVFSAYGPELRSLQGDGAAHARSRSAVGYAGAAALLEARGVPVGYSRGRPVDGLLVLTPRLGQDPADLEVGHDGRTLIVLPKWSTAAHPRTSGWVESEGPAPVDLVEGILSETAEGSEVARAGGPGGALRVRATAALLPGLTPGARLATGKLERLQTVQASSWIPIVTGAGDGAVLAKHSTEDIYVLADPDLMNTHGLADLRTATTAMRLLDGLREGGPVTFDLTLHGQGRERGLLRVALSPPFLGATLCLAAAALLMGLHAAARFGPAERPARAFALGKTALADNTAALIRLTRREPRMARGYAELVRAAAARAVGAPRDLDAAQLEAFLDRLSQRRGATSSYGDLAASADQVASRDDLVRLARALQLWKTEITGEHR